MNVFLSLLKRFFSASILFFVVMIVLLSAAFFTDRLRPVSASGESAVTIDFSVRPGMRRTEIAQQLVEQHIIKSQIVFELYVVLTGRAGKFKPGVYTVGSDRSTQTIVDQLTKGPLEVEAKITPGMTMAEIEDLLVSQRVLDKGQLTQFPVDTIRDEYPFLGDATLLEGFLFPDTYRFYPHSAPAVVVGKILDNFKTQAAPLLTGLHNGENNDTIHWLILASILEKEVTNKKEAQTVAGIFEKRLAIGMPLQVDASIIYAKCRRFTNCPALTRADFSIESPYNTYLHKGLPPTPISNPGLDAISAARSPVRSNYLYYLSDPRTKQTIFSKTFEEHNANRTNYLLNQ